MLGHMLCQRVNYYYVHFSVNSDQLRSFKQRLSVIQEVVRQDQRQRKDDVDWRSEAIQTTGRDIVS